MNRKQLCVANVRYKQPSTDGAKQSKNLLRYLTYRESRDEAARYATGRERWVDQGMGGSVAKIAQRCDDLKSEHVLAFNLVLNPNPDLIAMVDVHDREAFLHELTAGVLEDFFDARGLDTGCEVSYVLHHRLTDDLQAPGRHNPHVHAVLPGTVYDEDYGMRVPLFFSRNRKVNHVEMLHVVTEQVMVEQMQHYVGRDWEQRYDQLEDMRAQERLVVLERPHGHIQDDTGEGWDLWCGTRRTDEHTSAVGYYRYVPQPDEDDSDNVELVFSPLLSGLSPSQARLLAQFLAQDTSRLQEHMQQLKHMDATQIQRLIEILERPEQGNTLDFDR